MEETLQRKTTPQCSRLPPASTLNYHLDGTTADEAITINFDQPDEATQILTSDMTPVSGLSIF